MATYTVSINLNWPEGTADTVLGVFDVEDEARAVLETALDGKYPKQWARANDAQYAPQNSVVGDTVMGLIQEKLTPYEFRQRQIEGWRQTVNDARQKLHNAEIELAEWEEKQRTKSPDED